jgi:hypothetical protein
VPVPPLCPSGSAAYVFLGSHWHCDTRTLSKASRSIARGTSPRRTRNRERSLSLTTEHPEGILGGPKSVEAYMQYLGIDSLSELEPIEAQGQLRLEIDTESDERV